MNEVLSKMGDQIGSNPYKAVMVRTFCGQGQIISPLVRFIINYHPLPLEGYFQD
ncbi:MAG: hypothetical protein HXX80_06225 [Nitrososphaerales archaeon]|nr:hypothetical protein [Nitrososphaerales archaeon]